MPGMVTSPELKAQHEQNIRLALQALKFDITQASIDLIYQKYMESKPGTSYQKVIRANSTLLSKDNCGCT